MFQEHVIFEDYSHIDFVWNVDIHKDVYKPILNTISKLDSVP
jgi:hypothetical protein